MSNETLRIRQIVRYTDPDGNTFDAMVEVVDGDTILVQTRSDGDLVARSKWVPAASLSVPE
jgi:hypothetical protein